MSKPRSIAQWRDSLWYGSFGALLAILASVLVLVALALSD
jgi:hypothetical protein